MKLLKADLHIHTVLSPCADLEMSPGRIVAEAVRKGLNIIGITDHNTTRHCSLVTRLAAEKGIFVMQGAEVTTKEEVHCLAFFENNELLKTFQEFLDMNLPEVMNNTSVFGYQVEVDENEIVIYEEKKLLLNAISKSIGEVEAFVHSLKGLFIPAHIDRKKNSIYSQLGFLPADLKADALEISRAAPEGFAAVNPEINKFPVIKSSDSHILETIGAASTLLNVEKASFSDITMALKSINGRKIVTG
jgi:PHP family Zn ribbon phosphoesterase